MAGGVTRTVKQESSPERQKGGSVLHIGKAWESSFERQRAGELSLERQRAGELALERQKGGDALQSCKGRKTSPGR